MEEAQPMLVDFAGRLPNTTYYVDASHSLAVKAEVLRLFLTQYKHDVDFTDSRSEGAISGMKVTAMTGEKPEPTLVIEPIYPFFEGSEEWNTLTDVFYTTLEMRYDLEERRQWDEETRQNRYPLLRTRSLRYKRWMIDTFLTEFRERRITTRETEDALYVIATTGVAPDETQQILIVNYLPSRAGEREALVETVQSHGERLKKGETSVI